MCSSDLGGLPNCSVSMIAANGLMNLPEGSAACSCSYNFHTSVALAPDEDAPAPWCVFAGTDPSRPVRTLRVNFGAPGDHAEKDGARWFAWPRPGLPGAAALPIAPALEEAALQNRSTRPGRASGDARLSESGLSGRGDILVQVTPPAFAVAPAVAEPPAIDGDDADAAWARTADAAFQLHGRAAAPRERLRFLRGETDLFVVYRERAARNGDRALPFAVTVTNADDAAFAADDHLEILVTDDQRRAVLLFGASPGNARFDARAAPDRAPDLEWDSGWRCAARNEGEVWCAEMAIPLAALREAGLDPETLRVNALVRRRDASGPEQFYLAHPGDEAFAAAARTLPLRPAAEAEASRSCRIRVLLRAADAAAPPIEVAANEQRRAVGAGPAPELRVVVFRSVKTTRDLVLRVSSPASAPAPEICALEVTVAP